jgi:hypothetical protein
VSLAGAWLVYPLLLVAVGAGWGLIVEWVAGARLPAPLLPALGLCALAGALTLTSATVPDLALTITVCGALGGVALRALAPVERGAERARGDAPAFVAAGAAFALLAAPVVLTGAPAVSGYLRLDDTTTFLALGDWVLRHGHSTAGLPPSTYEAAIQLYLAGGYPVGSILPLAATGRLTGIDLIWLWMPFLAVLGGLLAAAVAVLTRPLMADGRVRAVTAVTASCSALLLGYVLWGGIKEIWTAAMAATLAALVPWTLAALQQRRGTRLLRACVPGAVAVLGLVCALSVAGIVWAVPAVAALGCALAVARGHGRRIPVVLAATLVAGLAIVPLLRLVPFVDSLSHAPGSGPDWLGNLLRPIRFWQVGGIWPARDFRVAPVNGVATGLLLAAATAGAAWALWRATRLRAWGVLAYAGVLVSAAAVIIATDWAWGEGKALAIGSPVLLALAGAGAGQLLAGDQGLWRRGAGAVVLGAMVIGVGWSYALAFQGTTLTPHDRHAELQRIGERFEGRGPTLATEFDPYAGRWFLRRMAPEVAGELRRRTVELSGGGVLAKGASADIDRFAASALAPYRMLVTRRSPAASRPPAEFRRVWRGRWYEVWERGGVRPAVAHVGLGGVVDPSAVPACSQVRRVARLAGPGGTVRAALTPSPAVAGFDAASPPAGWRALGGGSLVPDGHGTGTARATVSVPAAGRYEVWVGGAFRGSAEAAVDGVRTGRLRHQLSYPGNWVPFGTADLSAGPHAVTVRLDGGGIHPGVHGIQRYAIGPVALRPATAGSRILVLPSSAAGALCGRRLDWIEAVR